MLETQRFAGLVFRLTREIGFPGRRGQRVENIAVSNVDFFDWPLSYDAFTTGPSDYDISSDEVYCPCGETLAPWDGTAGDMLRLIAAHCSAKADHPRPRHDP